MRWSAVCLLSADCFGGCRYTNVLQIRMPLPPDIWRWVGTIVQMFGGGLGQLSSKCSSTTATNGQLSSKSSSTTATLPPTFGGHLYRDFEPICVKKLSTDIFDILCGRSLREFLLLFSPSYIYVGMFLPAAGTIEGFSSCWPYLSPSCSYGEDSG